MVIQLEADGLEARSWPASGLPTNQDLRRSARITATMIFSTIMLTILCVHARTAISGLALRQSRVCPEHWIQATKKYGANLREGYMLCARRKLRQKFGLMNET